MVRSPRLARQARAGELTVKKVAEWLAAATPLPRALAAASQSWPTKAATAVPPAQTADATAVR